MVNAKMFPRISFLYKQEYDNQYTVPCLRVRLVSGLT